MDTLELADSVIIARSPGDLYDMVSDVTRMGQWSPVCTSCWWDEGAGPSVGSHFTGRNELPDRTWETHCEVVAAERGKEFAFVVGEGWVRWGYRFEETDGGTTVTESWALLPAGVEMFKQHFGDQADTQIAQREEAARTGIPTTLAALKRVAETGS